MTEHDCTANYTRLLFFTTSLLLLPQIREHRFQLTYNTKKDINVAKDLSTTTTATTTPKVSGY